MPDAIKETLTDLLIIPPGVRRPHIPHECMYDQASDL